MNFWNTVKQDLRHHLDGPFYELPKKVTFLRIIMAILTPEFRLVFLYRIYHGLYKNKLITLSYLLYLFTKSCFYCDIAKEAEIGAGMRITHPFDIVIGPDVKIGKDLVIFNGVTLGNRLSRKCWTGMPKLGSRVLIGSGAKILGPIEIADEARIGANAVVLDSVPSGATAVGNPAKIIAG